MIWVRDRGGLLDPEALRPTAEELENGAFDPELDDYFKLQAKKDPLLDGIENDRAWFGEDDRDLGKEKSKWFDPMDPDSADERVLAAWDQSW